VDHARDILSGAAQAPVLLGIHGVALGRVQARRDGQHTHYRAILVLEEKSALLVAPGIQEALELLPPEQYLGSPLGPSWGA